MPGLTYVYLHGLCSSPGSNKRRFLQGKLAPFGLENHAPELNVPSFEGLTNLQNSFSTTTRSPT